MEQRAAPKQDVGGEFGLLPGKAAGHVVGGDVLVDRVGLDVLVEEVGRVLVEAETAQRVAVAAVRHREVISNIARWPTIAPRRRRRRPNNDIRLTVASVTPGSGRGRRPRESSSSAFIVRAKSRECIRSGRPEPYSSNWTSSSAAFGAPSSRGIAQLWGSASFSW